MRIDTPKRDAQEDTAVTVGVAVRCKDGIVIAADSLATFSRGAPVARYTNKVFTIEHRHLQHPVVMIGAGMTAFMDKFVDRAGREGITAAHNKLGRKLGIVDFVEHVGETLVSILLKEYVFDRAKFFGTPMSDYSLSMVIAGATNDKKLRTYHIHSTGLSESIEGYGTVGSGAAYAELFLHGFIPKPNETSVRDAVRLVSYAIKGVEIMDPHVGGDTRMCTLKMDKDKLVVAHVPGSDLPSQAKERMETVLQKIGTDMREAIEEKSEPVKDKPHGHRSQSPREAA